MLSTFVWKASEKNRTHTHFTSQRRAELLTHKALEEDSSLRGFLLHGQYAKPGAWQDFHKLYPEWKTICNSVFVQRIYIYFFLSKSTPRCKFINLVNLVTHLITACMSYFLLLKTLWLEQKIIRTCQVKCSSSHQGIVVFPVPFLMRCFE